MFAAVALAVLTVLPGSAGGSIAASHPGITSQHVTVHSGDTLSGIAATHCHGNASDWTGLYHRNAKTIGGNPNLILPGQVFSLAGACVHADPPGYTPAGRPLHASGKTWGISYGFPNFCGDGDKDGWDVSCGHASHSAASLPVASSSIGSGGSAYSAFPGAACNVAAESGGNPTAQNPGSSASGLFQDLSTTWNNYDGYSEAKYAPVSVQIAFNQHLAATAGLSQWAADGCPGT